MIMREKEIYRILGLLGSRWSRKEEEIKLYACNLFFDELSDVYVILMVLKNPKFRRLLKNPTPENLFKAAKMVLEVKGKALWIGNSDTITQLAIKTGVTKEVEY